MVKRREQLRSARCLTEVRDGDGLGLVCRANTGAINVLWAIRPATKGSQATLSVLGRYLLTCGSVEEAGRGDCKIKNDIAI